jgi:hypothetical protein
VDFVPRGLGAFPSVSSRSSDLVLDALNRIGHARAGRLNLLVHKSAQVFDQMGDIASQGREIRSDAFNISGHPGLLKRAAPSRDGAGVAGKCAGAWS